MFIVTAYLKFEILRLARNRRYVVVTLGVPVAFYLMFTRVFQNFADAGNIGGSSWTAYFMASMAAFGAMGAVLSVGGARLAAERTSGWTRQLRLTPLPPTAYVATKVLAALALALPVIVLVTIVGAVVNHVALPASTWFEVIVLLWLGTLPFSALSVWLGYLLDGDSGYGGTVFVNFGLAMFGGMWVPLNVMPPTFRRVAALLPSYHFAQLGWRTLAGRGPGLVHVGVLLAYLVVFGLLALSRYRREEGTEYA